MIAAAVDTAGTQGYDKTTAAAGAAPYQAKAAVSATPSQAKATVSHIPDYVNAILTTRMAKTLAAVRAKLRTKPLYTAFMDNRPRW